MSDLHQLVGEANGKLDTLLVLMRDHIVANDRRFGEVDVELKAHAADINKAKGAKNAVLLLAGGCAAVVSAAAVAIGKAFGH